MDWINIFGLAFMIVIMIPNVIFAVKCKDGFENLWKNRAVELLEQIGRFGCFGFMVFNIPGTWLGFAFDEAFAVYLMADSLLVALYCAVWALCFRKDSIFRALALSVLPSVIFLFSGIMLRSLLLIASAVIFAPCHILISCKNAAEREKKRSDAK